MIGPDGRKYKALFASFITDMDNKINLNAAGNVRGTGNTHVSNMGLGPWEINPTWTNPMWAVNGDYQNLFLGSTGRYGPTNIPGAPGASTLLFNTFKAPQWQLGLDPDAVQNNGVLPAAPSVKFNLPGETWNGVANPNPAYFGFLGFPNPSNISYGTYGNSPVAAQELLLHPSLFNVFNPLYYNGSTNRLFPDAAAEAFYRNMGTGSQGLTASPFRLSYASMNDPTGAPSACSPAQLRSRSAGSDAVAAGSEQLRGHLLCDSNRPTG